MSVHGMKTDGEFVNALEDEIRKRGAMEKIITDCAKAEISKRVKDILRNLYIDDYQSEPHHQNQNIADSNAPISRDLRAIVHEQLETGATDSEIIDFLVDRYGEFVRYRPGLDRNTLWLWSAPLILLLMAIL